MTIDGLEGATKVTVWQEWLHHPEKCGVRNAFFQVHLWLGVVVGMYTLS